MKDNLYDVLGVGDSATQDDVKLAYRNRMKEIHPDKNGGIKHPNHDAVKHAYDVLADAGRRERYDESGDEGEEVDSFAAARHMVASLFVQIIKSDGAMGINIRDEIIKILNNEEANANRASAASDAVLKRIVKIKDRSKPDGKATFIASVIDNSEQEVMLEKAQYEDQLKVIQAAKEIISDFEYHFDSPLFTQNNSSLGSWPPVNRAPQAAAQARAK